jgi:hypothetical protein
MSTTTIAKPKTVTCNRCGAIGLHWKTSKRTNRPYLAETVLVQGRVRAFRREVLHKCTPRPLHTETAPARVYGRQTTVVENPATHEHVWHAWRPAPGSTVTGVYCFGCNTLLID